MSTEVSQIYPWITETFILDKLKSIEQGESITLTSYNVDFMLDDGENFCSDIIRITANYTVNDSNVEKLQRFVMKACIPAEDFGEIASSYDFFRREIEVYRRVLPKVEPLLQSIGDAGTLSPRW